MKFLNSLYTKIITIVVLFVLFAAGGVNYYTKVQSDAKYLAKADTISATDLFYTKTQSDANYAKSGVNFILDSEPISYAAPVDGATYYFGSMGGLGLSENAAAARQYTLPYNCTLVGWDFSSRPGSAAASTETMSLSVRKNNTTDQLLSSSIALAGAFGAVYFSGTGLTTEYSAGDKIELKLVAPTWATNPNNWVVSCRLYFKLR